MNRLLCAKYGVRPLDTERAQVSSRSVAGEFSSGSRPDMKTGTRPLEGLKAVLSIAANQWWTFGTVPIDVSRAKIHAKAQRPVLVRVPVEDQRKNDVGHIGLSRERESMYSTRDGASNWKCVWQSSLSVRGQAQATISWSLDLQRDSSNSRTIRKECSWRQRSSAMGQQQASKLWTEDLRWEIQGVVYNHDTRRWWVDHNSEPQDPERISRQIASCQVFVSHPRSSWHNAHCEWTMSADVERQTTTLSESDESWETAVVTSLQLRSDEPRSNKVPSIILGRWPRNTSVLKCGCGAGLQSHVESIHAQTVNRTPSHVTFSRVCPHSW